MTGLDELERDILKNARSCLEPEPTDAVRNFERLTLALGLSAATTPPCAAAEHGILARLRSTLAKKQGLAVTCATLGAAGGFAAGYFVATERTPVAQVTSTAAAVHPPQLDAHPKLTPETVGSHTSRPSKDADPPAAVRTPTTRGFANSTVEAPKGDALAEELALLKRTDRAIRNNNALLALGLLRELDQRFPTGKLLVERQAARIMAHCLQQDAPTARQTAESYLRSAKTQVYSERVRQLCGISTDANQVITEKDPAVPGD